MQKTFKFLFLNSPLVLELEFKQQQLQN
jgi:hypothetical protein